jgi:hypothetical protein
MNKGFASGLLKMMGGFLLLDLFALALGFSFFMIMHGILTTLARSAAYWSPANKLMFHLTGISKDPIPLNGYHSFRLFVWLILLLVYIVAGTWILFKVGFCNQNLICLSTR